MAIAYTYDDKAIRENLMDFITNLSPTESQIYSGLEKVKANSIFHEWLVESLGSVKTNAHVEGATISFNAVTNPSRLLNVTQIFAQGFKVTGSEQEAAKAGGDDRYAREVVKAMKMLKNDIEYALVRSTLASGTGSAARSLKGIKAWLSLVTNQSGASLTESALNDYFQLVWTNTSTTVDAVYCPMYIKRKIAGFTGAATVKNVDVEDKRLINSVDYYSGDAAPMVKLFPHRYVTVSGDTNYDIVGISEEMFQVAHYREPKVEETAKVADSRDGFVLAELTLVCKHQGAGFSAVNHR